MIMTKSIASSVLLAIFGLTIQSCNRSNGQTAGAAQESVEPEVLNGGTTIVFPPHSPQLRQFTVDTVREQAVHAEFSAPAHVAVSVVGSELQNNKIYLFESQDLSQLYSDLVTSTAALERSAKNLRRLQDLALEKAVSDKELLDAQTDYQQAQAALAQKESMLRAAGLDPKELRQTPMGSVIAIADVPENQLGNLQQETQTVLQCDAFPDNRFVGRISAMGDVIDPVTRTVKVRIALVNSARNLRAGMYGTAHFAGAGQKVVAIPVDGAVRESDGSMTVWVTTDLRAFVHRSVKIGLQTDGKYQIADGLRPGELIVSEGGVFLSNMLQAAPND